MSNISESERERRRVRIHETKPWLKSTGARTELGKAISSQNALRHGMRSQNRLIKEIANHQLYEAERERIRAIVIKMLEAYKKSKTSVNPLWQEGFEYWEDYFPE
jgi:hypothetical protein